MPELITGLRVTRLQIIFLKLFLESNVIL